MMMMMMMIVMKKQRLQYEYWGAGSTEGAGQRQVGQKARLQDSVV